MMANEEHLKILTEDLGAWSRWRAKYPDLRPDLRGADLGGTDLRDADLHSADLRGAILHHADLGQALLNEAVLIGTDFRNAKLVAAKLISADLRRADLRRADLRDAKLSRANFHGADLRHTNLRRSHLSNGLIRDADLRYADLRDARVAGSDFLRAKLDGANLERVRMQDTALRALDLGVARGLETVLHLGASTVGNDTLSRSRGKIPETFLRGCGLSDWEIVSARLYEPNLPPDQVRDTVYEIARIKAESPVQINPLFISYSHSDSSFVEALEAQLDKKRIRFWRDIHHLRAGRLEEQLNHAIRQNPIVLLVLSENSIKSDWVEWEINKARELERDQERDVLCPIALDDSWKDCRWEGPLRRQVEKYNILDFSKWRDARAMVVVFQKLIDGLGLFYPNEQQI